MPYDLSHYLGADYQGEYLSRYVLTDAHATHGAVSFGGRSDPIVASDIRHPHRRRAARNLAEWIRYNGLVRIKIKLAGNDLAWDLARVIDIDRATAETQRERGVARMVLFARFQRAVPQCGLPAGVPAPPRERTAAGFDRIQYVEQPTARDLKADRANVMHRAAKLRPVVIDESLTDIESLMLAREMGYSGAALKACKGQSQVLLMAAAGARSTRCSSAFRT